MVAHWRRQSPEVAYDEQVQGTSDDGSGLPDLPGGGGSSDDDDDEAWWPRPWT